MFSPLAFILSTLAPLFLPVSLIANGAWWFKQRQSKRRGTDTFRAYIFPIQFLLLVAFTIFLEPLMLTQYSRQFTDYFLLKFLKPSEVTSISIETFTWDQPADIKSLTQGLNRAAWYLPNHEERGPFVPMRVNLATGKTLYFKVGQYYNRDGVIIQFFRLDKNGKELEEGIEVFVPGFPARLQQLWYLLPLLPGH